jgi:hypothetical protein
MATAMKPRLIIILSILLFAVKSIAGDGKFNLDSQYNQGTLRLEIDNDIIWNRDSNFTNGWSVQYHKVRYDTWDEAVAPRFCKWIGKHVPTLGDQDSIVRFGQGVGQMMITPNDITNPDPPDGDLPYAGSLTYTLNWQSFNRQTARTFQITMGVLGEASYAGDVQKFLHNSWGWGEDPKGWDTQRETDQIVNLAYQHLFRLAQKGTYTNDWAGHIFFGPTAVLGNLMTSIEAGIGFRVGWNMQEGFNSFQAPPGVGIFQAAHIPKPATASPHGAELVVGGRAMGLLYSVIYDGSLITGDNRTVERENFVFSGLLGLNYHYYDFFSLRLAVIRTSDILVEERLPPPRPGQKKTDTDNSFGTLMIDFHF